MTQKIKILSVTVLAVILVAFATTMVRAYSALSNNSYGTLLSVIHNGDTTGATFTVKPGANSGTWPAAGFYVVVYPNSAACPNSTYCGSREYIFITTRTGNTFTIGSRDQRGSTHGADWPLGSRIEQIPLDINFLELQQAVDSKASSTAVPTRLADLQDDSNHRTVTDSEKAAWNVGGPGGSGGTIWYTFSGICSSNTGTDSDFCLDTTTGNVYQKANGSWGYIMNLTGPTGPSSILAVSGGLLSWNTPTLTLSPNILSSLTGTPIWPVAYGGTGVNDFSFTAAAHKVPSVSNTPADGCATWASGILGSTGSNCGTGGAGGGAGYPSGTGFATVNAGAAWGPTLPIPLTAAYGGTGNQYFSVAGPTLARTYTFPDASTTICGTNTVCSGYQASLGFTPVPNTRTVNGKALSSDIVLGASDISNVQTRVTGSCQAGAVSQVNSDGTVLCSAASVASFNTRTGMVTPQAGDYTASMTGAVASSPSTTGLYCSTGGADTKCTSFDYYPRSTNHAGMPLYSSTSGTSDYAFNTSTKQILVNDGSNQNTFPSLASYTVGSYCKATTNGNLDCTATGGGSGSGTINSGTQYHLLFYTANGTTAGDSGIIADANGYSITTPKQSGVADSLILRQAHTTDPYGIAWMGPASRTTGTNLYLQFPDADPAGQVLSCAAPSAGVSACSWASIGGGGNVSNTGTPLIHQWPVWTNATTIKGLAVTGSKVVCTDANGEPTACTNLTDAAIPGYPGAGIPISTGTAWGTSLSETDGDIIYGSSGAWTKGTALPNGVTATTQAAFSNDIKVATDAYVDSAVPKLYSGSTNTVAFNNSIVICTANCTIAMPTPAAGIQVCARNGNNGSYTITFNALGGSIYYEKPDHSGYGTAGTGTLSATAATTNNICLLGLDATHYLVWGSPIGTWTAN